MKRNHPEVWLFIAFLSVLHLAAQAQTDTSAKAFTFSAYAEGFYAYDFNEPDNDRRPAFLYHFNRHHQPRINLALIKGSYQQQPYAYLAQSHTYSALPGHQQTGICCPG